MYLKSIKIKNFRKFGDKNNIIEFVGSKDLTHKYREINIAPSTTLIVGKNNSGKTTVTEALYSLINGRKFKSNDFNFIFLNNLLDEYKDKVERFPSLEFEFLIRIDFNNDCDLVTNVAPFMSIESVQPTNEESDFRVLMKYELQETESFAEGVKKLPFKNGDESTLFRKFLELIDSNDFKYNYYDSEGDMIGENKFKISDLIKIKRINANKINNDSCLSETFNKIIKLRYNLNEKQEVKNKVADEIDNINTAITNNIAENHTSSINEALNKIESSDRMGVNLRSDLTFEEILKNVIKYEYKEGKFHIPEGQFGLGYTNMMKIIGDLIEYIEEYPKQECQSKINIICIEEPEAFMHSQMQELFIKHINDAFSYLLKDMQKQINSQLIITTHSPHILNSKIHSGNSFDNISYITIVDNFSNVVNLNDRNIMEKKSADTDGTGGEQPQPVNDLKFLKKHIKYKVSELFFSDAVIFVEGITEETLINYYIDQNEELNRYYISVFNIDGAHGLVYHSLIKLLKVPCLIITDLDIKRDDCEKNNYTQIDKLSGRETTNKTISYYNPEKKKIENLKNYFCKENICIVFQWEALESYYATSFEEAFILTNFQNSILNKVLFSVKPQIYSEIVGAENNKENLKENSYKLQSKLSTCKSDFSNNILYEIIVEDNTENNPKMPKYIIDGLDWISTFLKVQFNGGTI